jgi:hypothetical protein
VYAIKLAKQIKACFTKLLNKKKKMSNTFDDLYQLFYVAAYGCNRRCESEIRKAVFAHRQETPFLFFEFLLTQPIPKAKEIKALAWEADWEKGIFVVAPFAPRMVEHSVVVPGTGKGGRAALVFRNNASFHKLRLAYRWDFSELANQSWKHWSCPAEPPANAAKVDDPAAPTLSWPCIADNATNVEYCVGFVDDWKMTWQQTDYPAQMNNEPFSQANAYSLAKLYEPLFLDNETVSVPGLFVPIASSNLYYGGVWVMLPGHDNKLRECLRTEVGLRLAQLIDKTYLPVLTVLHEHWLEKLHKDRLEDNNSREATGYVFDIPILTKNEGEKLNKDNPPHPVAKFRNVFLQLKDVATGPGLQKRHTAESADALEGLMCRLWQRRDVGQSWEMGEAFKDSLIFEKYLICSERMAKLLGRVVVSAKTLQKSGKTLPACLVVGGAGSGKEDLARMLRLFSADRLTKGGQIKEPSYYAGKENVVNLAAIRPAPLTAALMTGLEVKGTMNLEFKGILQRIREESHGKAPPTLRLDEFNSMDPDSQGVLLRFLDNSEIIPVGGAEDASRDGTDCLVVGIMNEDPEDISREKAMEFFRKGEYLGKFVGDLLYEHFIHIRRLRPDVMYRMIRNGKFIIPDLRERREDIPLLFQVFVKKELKGIRGVQSGLHISLDVLHRLIQGDLNWPGNVRQLQALAKVVSERLSVEQENTTNWYVVTASILEHALQEVGLLVQSE